MPTLTDITVPTVAAVRAKLIDGVLALLASPTSDVYDDRADGLVETARTFVEVADITRTIGAAS